MPVSPDDDPVTPHVVEKILDHRGTRNTKYLVRWEGYNPSFDLWIPASSFDSDVPLRSYWSSVLRKNPQARVPAKFSDS